MTQLLEIRTCLTDYLNIIEPHYRYMTNHHQCLDVIRLLFQMNAK